MPLAFTSITQGFLALAAPGLLALLSLLITPGQAAAEPHDISYFSRDTAFSSVKISPDGKHLAVMTPVDGRSGVAILNTETLEPTFIARFSEDKQVGEYHWANSERLIARLEMFRGWEEAPTSAGEWYAVNVDGKKQKNIYGYRAGGASSKIKRAEPVFGYGQIVDLLEDDPDNILMSSTPFSRGAPRRPTLIKVNVYNGKHKDIALAPISRAQFLTDHQGRPRFVAGQSDDGGVEVYYREHDDDGWSLLSKGGAEDGLVAPLAFVDEHNVYVSDNTESSVAGVYTLNLKTGEKDLVYRNEIADPSNFWFTPNGRSLYALEVEPTLPTYVYINPESDEVKLLRNLLGTFPGQRVQLASQTLDGNLSIIRVSSDRNPGTFYLFDKVKMQARHLVHSRPWVDPDTSATVEPVEFEARDGLIIRGYLTMPYGKEARNLPLVVIPHGGPHGPRDWWGYKSENQFLANQGMAVLQVNFRGSGGYGRDFQSAGYRHWGDTIQYDIIDGTREMIDKGIVDKDRVCIYGGSFGGYSALQSPILEPDMFACAIGFVGVYDLEMMYTKGDIPTSEAGISILKKYIGEDKTQLREFSPVHHVDKLKTPLLIVHGEEDPRAPIEHAYALRDALDAIDYPYEWLVMDKEGHGFYNEKNREKMYKVLLTFLNKHLKPTADTVKEP
jgi:dipeptidyl aminopeptidase/acylaminoacyl peptidase